MTKATTQKKPQKTADITKKKPPEKPQTMADLLKSDSVKPPKKGAIVDAKVIKLSKKGVIFDIGWKSYAVLGKLETAQLNSYLPYLSKSDTVPVKIVVEESKDGYPVVSMQSFFNKGKWDIIEEKFKKEQEIEVVCGDFGKGGVFVDFMGIRGVIPKIQLTEEYIHHPEKIQGQKITVKILEVDQKKNRLVVSQKASELKISYKEIKDAFDKIKEGKKYTVKVIGFSEFGAFCELNKIEGLIHISEISWEKVTDPKKYLTVSQEVNVIVVEKNISNMKLNLSIKRLQQDPWLTIAEKYPADKEIYGEVIRKEKYGYIVRLEPGIEGLIHKSKLTETEDVDIGKKIRVYLEK